MRINRKKFAGLFILVIFIFTYCGGPQRQPETEPPQPPVKTEAPAQEPAVQTNGTPGAEKIAYETIEVTDEPASNELVPVIEPAIKEPGAVEPPEIKKISDSINTGISDIFKGFGYPGDIQVPENFKNKVAYYIRYFSSHEKGARFYQKAMSRGSKYLPMIKKVLMEKHLPQSLAYLPLIESGYNTDARSRAAAVGMWQFMKGTARMYGLKVTRWQDERRDPVKSTQAAAEYLNDLLAMFGVEDPFLGICAYNAGEGKILRALRKISYKERSFWTLVNKNLLRNETDEYIPRLLAVVLMAKDPARYAAALPAVSEEEDETLEQEVLASLQPSKDNLGEANNGTQQEEITLKPVETPKKPKTGQTKSSTYTVRRGDTLYSIAKRFGVGVSSLKKWNGLRSSRIHPGLRLTVYAQTAPAAPTQPSKTSGEYKLVYTVNYTDSLARIALFFKGVSVRDIMRWNRLKHTRIHPKQKLALYLDQAPRKVLPHVVKRGEDAAKIAEKYNMRLEYVLSLNGLVTDSRIKPGKRLKIYYF